MKKYILVDDCYCEYLAKSKKDLVDYIRANYKSWKYNEIENIKDLNIRYIKYNWKKIDVDDFYWDVIATEKKTDEPIDYDLYQNYWIIDWICKKDFLYYNL